MDSKQQLMKRQLLKRAGVTQVNNSTAVISRNSVPRVISASVGKRGKNRGDDVVTIQELLNQIPESLGGPNPLLDEDRIAGPKTTVAIKQFQLRHFARSGTDGRVDPGKQTLRKLNEHALPVHRADLQSMKELVLVSLRATGAENRGSLASFKANLSQLFDNDLTLSELLRGIRSLEARMPGFVVELTGSDGNNRRLSVSQAVKVLVEFNGRP